MKKQNNLNIQGYKIIELINNNIYSLMESFSHTSWLRIHNFYNMFYSNLDFF